MVLRGQESNLPFVVAYETTEPPLLYPRVKLKRLRRRDSNSHQLVYKTSALCPLSYAATNLMEREGFEPSPNSLQDCRSAELSYHPKSKPPDGLVAEAGLEPAHFRL